MRVLLAPETELQPFNSLGQDFAVFAFSRNPQHWIMLSECPFLYFDRPKAAIPFSAN